ncbi:MAG: glycine--tRNA ligase [Pseudonocardiaceae bacterium]
MQDALLALTRYWTDQGCMIAQPMNTEVGAGTLNPATFLRVLGPEPWRVAYVEPSVRPDDSRYGENPNRIQTHTQFQVILKPEPGNPQQLYLDSLRALGIDIGAHDVRFVEDNWASPALGAWGLGWEVWLDGLEITQFTYFQQAGGLTLDPVSVELTYGIERILMALQGVSHFKDVEYAPGISYGEVFGQSEYEMSRYYLDDADIDTNRALFDAYAAEARRMVDARLPVPAHSYVLKCSHAFNVLDARGAISTTERARTFARMRNLAREAAGLWVARRRELGHPLGLTAPLPAHPLAESGAAPSGPATLVFEVGVEEMPPGEVTRIAQLLHDDLTAKLAATRLGHGEVRVHSSPRRVIALVAGVRPREASAERTVRGPRASAAFAPDGEPTKAALGFARGQGVEVADLQRFDVDGVDYVGVVQDVPGRAAVEVLAGILPEVIAGLRAEKNMRWNAPGLSFTRPIRWVLALLGEVVVPFTVSSIASARTTYVHRTAPHPAVPVDRSDGYLDLLSRHGIVADADERRQQIIAGAAELAASAGGTIDTSAEGAVIDEVTNLVEQPNPLLGHFDESYLELPPDVLVTVMRKHQRYLPVRDAAGALLPHFVAVANGDCDLAEVRAGNEAVLRARYEDAAFFWRADLAVRPEQMRVGLTALTFEERLGSMADRADRIAMIASDLATRVELNDEERATLARAGELAKFDLASQMVIELPGLAGTMAAEYALHAGEADHVARALYEMELPRVAGGRLPQSLPGALLALADRLDLLAGLFALGAAPTGSSDPFGLRRAALGIVSILRCQPRLAGISIGDGLGVASSRQPVDGNAGADALEFVVRRYEQLLLDAGNDHKLVRAVLPLAVEPARADVTLSELAERIEQPAFAQLAEAMQRVRRIIPPDTPASYDPRLFEEPAEHTLHEALAKARAELSDTPTGLAEFVIVAAVLVTPINDFFDDVLVMTDVPAVKANRLGLLAAIRDLGAGVLAWDVLT